MHLSTPLLLLSGATAALAGSFAAPAHPGHFAIRQATREQVVRRQVHGMQRVKRALASPVPGICGAPSEFVMQFSGLTDARFTQFNNNYGQLNPNDGSTSMFPVQALADATSMALTGSSADSCNLRASGEKLFMDTNGSDQSALYFDSPTFIAAGDYPAETGTCQVTSDVMTCAVGTADSLNMCIFTPTDDDGAVSGPSTYYLGIADSTLALANCAPVTVSIANL